MHGHDVAGDGFVGKLRTARSTGGLNGRLPLCIERLPAELSAPPVVTAEEVAQAAQPVANLAKSRP